MTYLAMSPPVTVLRQRLLARARARQLQVIARVAELGSMHKAAAEVGLTQPALSQQIAEIERLLEAPLFVRHSRGIELTDLGQALLPIVKRVLRCFDELAEHTAALQSRSQGVVRIVASSSAVSSVLAPLLPQFSHRHPEIAVHLREVEPADLPPLISVDEADMVVCRALRTVPQGWTFEPLQQDRLAVVAGAQHPLTRRRRVTLEDLAHAEWLSPPADSVARMAFDRLFEGMPLPSERRVTSRSPGIMWAMLEAQPLLAIMPVSLPAQFMRAGILREVRLEGALPLDPIGILLPSSGVRDAAAKLSAFLLASVSSA
jgi:DNA-binding transcriptional LysR family regulator